MHSSTNGGGLHFNQFLVSCAQSARQLSKLSFFICEKLTLVVAFCASCNHSLKSFSDAYPGFAKAKNLALRFILLELGIIAIVMLCLHLKEITISTNSFPVCLFNPAINETSFYYKELLIPAVMRSIKCNEFEKMVQWSKFFVLHFKVTLSNSSDSILLSRIIWMVFAVPDSLDSCS